MSAYTKLEMQSLENTAIILRRLGWDYKKVQTNESLSINVKSLNGHVDLGAFKSLQSLYLYNTSEIPVIICPTLVSPQKRAYYRGITSLDFSNNQTNLKRVCIGNDVVPNLERVTLAHPNQIEQVHADEKTMKIFENARAEAFYRNIVNIISTTKNLKIQDILWKAYETNFYLKMFGYPDAIEFHNFLRRQLMKELGQNEITCRN